MAPERNEEKGRALAQFALIIGLISSVITIAVFATGLPSWRDVLHALMKGRPAAAANPAPTTPQAPSAPPPAAAPAPKPDGQGTDVSPADYTSETPPAPPAQTSLVDWDHLPRRSTNTGLNPNVTWPAGPLAGGWWPKGTPVITQDPPKTEAQVWAIAESSAGACEPLRKYLVWFPDGAHAEAAAQRLKRISTQSQKLPVRTEYSAGPYILEQQGADCEMISAFQAGRVAGACGNSKIGKRSDNGDPTADYFRNSVSPLNCRCSNRGLFGFSSCDIVIKFSCRRTDMQDTALEICK